MSTQPIYAIYIGRNQNSINTIAWIITPPLCIHHGQATCCLDVLENTQTWIKIINTVTGTCVLLRDQSDLEAVARGHISELQCGGHNLPSLVKIGLSDLPPSPPVPPSLKMTLSGWCPLPSSFTDYFLMRLMQSFIDRSIRPKCDNRLFVWFIDFTCFVNELFSDSFGNVGWALIILILLLKLQIFFL